MATLWNIYTCPRDELDEDGSGAFHLSAYSNDIDDVIKVVRARLLNGDAVEIVPEEDAA